MKLTDKTGIWDTKKTYIGRKNNYVVKISEYTIFGETIKSNDKKWYYLLNKDDYRYNSLWKDQTYDSKESCVMAAEEKIKQLIAESKLTDKQIEKLWDELEDVLFVEAHDFFDDACYQDDITLVLASDWNGFSAGTTRQTIWKWFNMHHSKGLSYLVGA